MTKQAKANTVAPAPEVDPRIVQLLTPERSPADAGREAGLEVFEGLGANIMAFVRQHYPAPKCVDKA